MMRNLISESHCSLLHHDNDSSLEISVAILGDHWTGDDGMWRYATR